MLVVVVLVVVMVVVGRLQQDISAGTGFVTRGSTHTHTHTVLVMLVMEVQTGLVVGQSVSKHQ